MLKPDPDSDLGFLMVSHDFLLKKIGLWAAVIAESWLMCGSNSCHLLYSAFWKTSMPWSVVTQAAAVGGSPNLHPTAKLWKWTSGGWTLRHILKMCTGKICNTPPSYSLGSMQFIWPCICSTGANRAGRWFNIIIKWNQMLLFHKVLMVKWMIPINLGNKMG